MVRNLRTRSERGHAAKVGLDSLLENEYQKYKDKILPKYPQIIEESESSKYITQNEFNN